MRSFADMQKDWKSAENEARKLGLEKDMSYYIVEVAFFKSNPIHRAVYFHRSSGNIELMSSGYEGAMSRHISRLAHFKVLSELTLMNEQYRVKLPK